MQYIVSVQLSSLYSKPPRQHLFALSSSPSTVIAERLRNILLAPPSIRNASRSLKYNARLNNTDVIVLCEASRFIQVSCFGDFIEDRQYGGYAPGTKLASTAPTKEARFDGSEPHHLNHLFPTAVAPFTSCFRGNRYEGTRYASAPDHESPLASPSERILRIRQRKKRTGVLRLPPPDQASKTSACSLEGHSPTDQDPLRGRRRRSPSTQQRRSTSYTTTTSSTADPRARSPSRTCTRKAKSADCIRAQHTDSLLTPRGRLWEF